MLSMAFFLNGAATTEIYPLSLHDALPILIPSARLSPGSAGPVANFTADATAGRAPRTVHFTDLSSVPGAVSWSWDFGDGGTDTQQNPIHVYAADGIYTVGLTVTGTGVPVSTQKVGYITVNSTVTGLQVTYYNNADFTGTTVSRVDPVVDNNWGGGSPDPAIGADTFSARWQGTVTPLYTQTYTFYTVSDDGARLWVNDQRSEDRRVG